MSASAPAAPAAPATGVAETLRRAVDHHKNGRLDEAERLYDRILTLDPRNADALHLLGVIAASRKRSAAAIDLIERAIAIRGGVADYHNNLGGVLKQAGRLEDAVTAYRHAVMLAPTDPSFALNLAQVLQRLGRLAEAEESLLRAVEIDPRSVRALFNLGLVLQRQGRLAEAIERYERAVALAPGHADAWFNLGAAFHARDQLAKAERCYRQALSAKPDHVEALNNLGENLKITGRFGEAIEAFRSAIALDPERPWPQSNLLLAFNYDPGQGPATIAAEHRRIGALWERRAAPLDPAPRDADPARRLKLGLVSGDFSRSSCAFFIQALLSALDPREFDVACYAHVDRPDDVTAAMRRASPTWHDVRDLDPLRLATKIRDDGIDVLVDLAGHTRGNRLSAFAHKPAPVQVSWLGYPNTTGLSSIDYRLTDEVADPVGGADPYYTEKLIRLPRCFLCYAAPPDAPAVAPMPASRGVPITFGSFNNANKINATVAALWAEIVNAVPESRLLLKAKQFKDDEVRTSYRRSFERAGLSADRLVLLPWASGYVEHLAAYRDLDIGLDPFPYNGTATTCEALWMGVPVVTLAGRAHAGRVGVSLLRAVGLSELSAASGEEYVDTAVRLAQDRPRIAALRSGLRQRMTASELCDRAGFGRAIAAALRSAWRERREAPASGWTPSASPSPR